MKNTQQTQRQADEFSFGELVAEIGLPKAIREVFDGHDSPQDAIDYWLDLPDDAVAFGPMGFAIRRQTVHEGFDIARLYYAAQRVLSDNSGDLDTDTRSGCFVISQDALRDLRNSLLMPWQFNSETKKLI